MNITAVQNIDLHTTGEDSYKTRSQDINILEFTGTFLCVLRTTTLTPFFFNALMIKFYAIIQSSINIIGK